MQKFQRISLHSSSGSPIYCVFCGQQVIPPNDGSETTPCGHTVFVANEVALTHISGPAVDQLQRLGMAVTAADGLVEVVTKTGREVSIDKVIGSLRFRDALQVESFGGTPSEEAIFVGFASGGGG